MAKRDWAETEPAVFVPEVIAGAIAFGVLVSARAGFWLDKKIYNILSKICSF